MSELEKFSEDIFSISVNCNDTFGYACADATDLDMHADSDKIIAMWRKYGWEGLIALCALKRHYQPIKERRTPTYMQAWDEVKDYIFFEDQP